MPGRAVVSGSEAGQGCQAHTWLGQASLVPLGSPKPLAKIYPPYLLYKSMKYQERETALNSGLQMLGYTPHQNDAQGKLFTQS